MIDGTKRPARSAGAGDPNGGTSQAAVIELLPAQVERVVRAAADGGSIPVLLSGLERVRGKLTTRPAQLQDPRFSRSLLSGLLLVASLPNDGSYVGNAQLARALDMNVSTVHRYLQTLLAVGLVERDPGSRRYRLAQ